MTNVIQPFHLLVIALVTDSNRRSSTISWKRTVFSRSNLKDSGRDSPMNSGYDWP